MKPTLLCVDDEPLVLDAHRRTLRGFTPLECAGSGAEALSRLRMQPDIAAVMVDFRMPEMNGLELLEQIRQEFPRVQRMMLTGEADIQVALGAVNRGSVFRFLLKPVDRDQLKGAITAAFRQFSLEAAERDLLEKTVTGSVRMLIELLELADPKAFAQSSERRQTIRTLAQALQIGPGWVLELAAILSRMGELTLPPGLRDRMAKGGNLSDEETALAAKIGEVSATLLERVPRLEPVAQLIRDEGQTECSEPAMLLRICNQLFTQREQAGLAKAFTHIREHGRHIDMKMLSRVEDVLRRHGSTRDKSIQLRISIEEVLVGDRLLEELCSHDQRLLCAALVILSPSHVQRIHNYARLGLAGGKVLVERLRATGKSL